MIVALTIIAAVVGAKMLSFDFKGSGTESDPYTVGSQNEFKSLRIMANTSKARDTKGKFYKLTKDMTAYAVSGTDREYSFDGVLDGGGHTVTVYGDLFRRLGEGAVIKNCTLNIRNDWYIKKDYRVSNLDRALVARNAVGATLENVTINYSLIVDTVAYSTMENLRAYSVSTGAFFVSSTDVTLKNCDVNIDIYKAGGYISVGDFNFWTFDDGLMLDGCDVNVDMEFGVSGTMYVSNVIRGTRFDLSCPGAVNSSFDYDIKFVTEVDPERGGIWKYQNRPFETEINKAGVSLVADDFGSGSTVDIDFTYENRTSQPLVGFDRIKFSLPKSSDGVSFAAHTVFTEVVPSEVDGFKYVTVDGKKYIVDYTGGDTAVIPTSIGSCAVSNFVLLSARSVVIPKTVTNIYGAVFGPDLESAEYKGTVDEFDRIKGTYSGLSVDVSCSDGTYSV